VVNLTRSDIILIEFDCFSIRDTVFTVVVETAFLNTLYIVYIIIHKERDYMYTICVLTITTGRKRKYCIFLATKLLLLAICFIIFIVFEFYR